MPLYDASRRRAFEHHGWKAQHALARRAGRQRPAKPGTILSQPTYDDFRNVHLQAIKLCLRPLDPNLNGGFELADFQVVSRDEMVDGRTCMLLRGQSDASTQKIVRLLFIDPDREFIVLKWSTEVDGKLWAQVDVSYAQDPTVGWVPSGWTLFMPGSTLSERCTSTVTDYALNEPLSEKLFVIDFPPGTFVQDRPSETEYLLREKGEKRFIAPAERSRGASWGELMETEYGQAGLPTVPQPPDRTLFRLAWMTIAGLLGLAAFFYTLRVRRSGSLDEPGSELAERKS